MAEQKTGNEVPDTEAAGLAKTEPSGTLVGFGAYDYADALADLGKNPPAAPDPDDELPDGQEAAAGTGMPAAPGSPPTEPALAPAVEPAKVEPAAAASEPPTPPAETTPPPEPEKKPAEKPFWDPERQKRDQQIANLKKERDSLKRELTQREEGGGREVQEIADELAELAANPLDELTTEEEQRGRTQKLNQLTAELAASQVREKQSVADNEELDTVLDTVCGDPDVGAKYRNEIIAGLNKEVEKLGFGPGNWPSSEHAREIAYRIGLKLALAEKAKAPPPPPPKVAAPTLDKTTGGQAPPKPTAKSGRTQQFSTYDEALAYMAKHGELGPPT